MGHQVSKHVCCSARDKRALPLPSSRTAQILPSKVDLLLSEPRFVATAPIWSSEVLTERRLAVASTSEVHVYGLVGDSDLPELVLEHSLKLQGDTAIVTSILFADEMSARYLAIALSFEHSKKHVIRVWSCVSSLMEEGEFAERNVAWDVDSGWIHSLDDHIESVTRLVTGSTHLLTVDTSGMCHVWQASRSFQHKAAVILHSGGVVDLTADRFFAYSLGMQDMSVCLWSLPDLSQLRTIRVEIPQGIDMLPDAPRPARGTTYSLLRLTSLRRPLSRWVGCQGLNRHSSIPRGALYITAELGVHSESGDTSQGVLMEWSLGEEPACRNAVVAHNSPIIALVYGPYDNGPLITADAHGLFRVWNCVPRLHCCQQCPVTGSVLEDCSLAVVVQPRYGLYTVVGDSRLFVWRRFYSGDHHMSLVGDSNTD